MSRECADCVGSGMCFSCNGSGEDEGEACTLCGGQGVCPQCAGTGLIDMDHYE